MRKTFATNLLFLLIANLLVKPYWILGIDRVVQNKVGPEVYGTYFAVFNYSFLFSMLLDFGINNFNNRAVSRSASRLNSYFANLILLKLFLSILYLSLTFLSAAASGYSDMQLKMLFALCVNQILLSALLYFRSNIAALQLFKTDAMLSVLDRLLSITLCLLLMYLPALKGKFDITAFIYAQTIALGISVVVAAGIVAGRATIKWSLWSPRFTSKILLKSTPFALLALLMGIYYRIDGVMLERLLPNGKTEAGIYAASFRLLDALNMFGYLFATLLLPIFAQMLRRKENVAPLVQFSSLLMLAGSVTASWGSFFYREPIMQLLYHGTNSYWSDIFGLLMFNFIPMSSVYVFGTLLTASGQMHILNLIALAGVIINVSLNLLLIPTQGAWGAAVATFATQLITAVAHIIVAVRIYPVPLNRTLRWGIAVFLAASPILFFAAAQLPAPWYIQLITGSLLLLSLATVTGLVPIQEVRGLLLAKISRPKPAH